jgi:hypothetical protein
MNKQEIKIFKKSIGLPSYVFLILLTLKLLNLANIKWIWVFSPFWISAIIIVVAIALIIGVVLAGELIKVLIEDKNKNKNKNKKNDKWRK